MAIPVHDPYMLNQGDTWEIEGTLHDPDESAFDLSEGAAVQWLLKNGDGATILNYSLSNGIAVLDLATAKILITVPAGSTALIATGSYNDQLRATDPSGFTATQWIGRVLVTSPEQALLYEEFQARFPEFSSIDRALVDLLLAEAELFISDNWNSRDRKAAVLHLAAHAAQQSMLMQTATESSSTGSPIGDAELFVKSIAFTDRTVTWDKKFSGGTGSPTSQKMGAKYEDTRYGQVYLVLRRANVGGPLVV